jgi:hypothetical protein
MLDNSSKGEKLSANAKRVNATEKRDILPSVSRENQKWAH